MKIPKGAKVKEKNISLADKIDEIFFWVVVTAQDIKNGTKGNQHTCAIAQSLMRSFDEATVSVDGPSDIQVDGFKVSWVSSPTKIRSFIGKFDKGKKVAPFKFAMKLVPKNAQESEE